MGFLKSNLLNKVGMIWRLLMMKRWRVPPGNSLARHLAAQPDIYDSLLDFYQASDK